MRVTTPGLETFRYFYDSDIDGVVYWSDNFLSTYIPKELLYSKLFTTKDYFSLIDMVLYFPKKSALRNVFNEKLRRLSESGITEFVIKGYINNTKIKVKQRFQPKFHVDNIFDALQMCAVMYSISFIVFCLEVISLIHYRIKFILDYFTY